MKNYSVQNLSSWRGALLSLVCLGSLPLAQAEPFNTTRYVRIDHMHHTAYIHDENFKRLPDNPLIAGTSVDPLPADKPRWFLGAKVDVVHRNHHTGEVHVMSTNPAYSEMNHHFVWAYRSPNRPLTERCPSNLPIGTGSELTHIRLPAGYGYKMHGGFLMGGTWHWENPANVSHHEDVYLRYVFQFDDNPTGYRDTHVSWVGMVPCTEEFPVPSGKSTKEGPPLVADRHLRIVAVMPHVHDHAKYIELRKNGKLLRRFKPEYAAVPVSHDDVGQGKTLLHVHEDHMPVEGLSMWAPGIYGPIVRKGEALTPFGAFENPHPIAIDNMAMFIIFWEEVSGDPGS